MRFTLDIALDNAAFADDGSFCPLSLADAIREVAAKVERGHKVGGVYDRNGNPVGRFTAK